jgi:hypothetical protein
MYKNYTDSKQVMLTTVSDFIRVEYFFLCISLNMSYVDC